MERLVTEGATASSASNELSARDRVRAKRNARKRRKTLKIAAIVIGVVGVTLTAYSLGFTYFSSHYYPGTLVAGIDAAGMTEDELVRSLDDHVSSYAATIGNGSFELSFAGTDVDLSCDSHKIASDLMMFQDASSWPVGILGSIGRAESPELSFDAAKLAAIVDPAVATYNETARQPVAATLVLNAAKDEFSIKDEVDGTALDSAHVNETAANVVLQGGTTIELTDADLVQPTHRASDEATQAALGKANKVFDLTIPIAHGQDTLLSIGAKTFVPWLTVNDDLTLGVNADEAAHWADDILWQSSDYADDENVFAVDTAKFASDLSAAVAAGTGAPLQVPYATTPRYLPGGGALNPAGWNATYGRYIDVNKSAQVATLYDATGRVLWETPVTTGCVAWGKDTPSGEFAIYDRKTDFVLIGYDEDNDGKPDYEHHVDFWMPFNEGIGLHDASWRSVYGGTEYLESGSGGCVNVPLDAIRELYAMTHENEVVIVH